MGGTVRTEIANSKISRYAARVFCDINSKQAQVKNNLIYLIQYDVMGEHENKALSGKILSECHKVGNLKGVFAANSIVKKNSLELTPIPITTIVDNDLVPFLNGKKVLDESLIPEARFAQVFSGNRGFCSRNYARFWAQGKGIIDTYFGLVKEVYSHDWAERTSSKVQSAKYYSAFIRFLRYHLFDQGGNHGTMRAALETQKANIMAHLGEVQYDSELFAAENNAVPKRSSSIKDIFNFLLSPAG